MDNPWIKRMLWGFLAMAFCWGVYLFLTGGGRPPQELSPELNRELERILREKKY